MAEGGEEEWELVPTGRRRRVLIHIETARQGRGREELATPCSSSGRQGNQQQQWETGEAGGRGEPY